MRPTAALSLLLALGLAAAAVAPPAARATTVRSKDVGCPVCGKTITVQYIASWTGDGCDGDLAPRVAGGAVLPYSVWTCEHCRYSNRAGNFEKGVKEETKKRILAGLEAPGSTEETWVKFDLAARIAEWEGAAPSDRGVLLLNGAWAVRQEAWEALRPVTGKKELAPAFEAAMDRVHGEARRLPPPPGEILLSSLARSEAAAAAAEREAAAARAAGKGDPILDLAAAFLHRRTGENDAAGRMLGACTEPASPQGIRDAAAALAASMGRERAFQEAALSLLEPGARTPEGDAGARAWARITVADTLRRLGRPAEATPLILAAVKDEECPAWGVALVRHGLAKLGVGGEALEVVAAAEGRARASLRKRLTDPETAEEAARLIGDSADPGFFPDLVAALGQEDGDVREAAIMALHRMDSLDLPPDLVEALGRIALDRRAGRKIRESALRRLEEEAHPSSLPVFREGLEDPSFEGIRSESMDGLARCGEEEDAARLLAYLEKKKDSEEEVPKRTALRALTCLANREFADAGAAATWWETAKGRGRMAWVLEGFKAEGAEIAAPPTRASIPVLLGLLDSGKPWVRWNAHRILRSLTGKRFGWDRHTHVWNSGPLRREEERPAWVEDWIAWWAAEGDAK